MKQTTMQLHQISTNSIDKWFTVPAYLVPGTTTWYVVRAEDETRVLPGEYFSRSDAFGLFHDGLAAARFARLRDALNAGLWSGQVWDLPGLPEKTSPEYGNLAKIVHTAPGQWWNK